MKRIITLLLFTLSFYEAFSQDVITYKNGKTQKVTVLTTSEQNVTCQDFETKEQFTISRTFISEIKYQEGKTEPFGIVLAKPEKKVVANNAPVNNAVGIPNEVSSKYKNFTELGYAASLTNGVGSKFLFTTSHGVELQKQIFIGATLGLGYQTSKIYGKKFATTPENVLGGLGGVDFRIRLSQNDPYVSVGGKLGGFFALSGDFDTGFFYNPNFTFVTQASKKSQFVVSVGYMALPAIFYTYTPALVYNDVSVKYLTITGGISF